MYGTYSTHEVSRETGVSRASIHRWIAAGYLKPAVRALGKGDLYRFDETNVAQVRALAFITRQFGDGELTRRIIADVIPHVRPDWPSGSRHILVSLPLVV